MQPDSKAQIAAIATAVDEVYGLLCQVTGVTVPMIAEELGKEAHASRLYHYHGLRLGPYSDVSAVSIVESEQGYTPGTTVDAEGASFGMTPSTFFDAADWLQRGPLLTKLRESSHSDVSADLRTALERIVDVLALVRGSVTFSSEGPEHAHGPIADLLLIARAALAAPSAGADHE